MAGLPLWRSLPCKAQASFPSKSPLEVMAWLGAQIRAPLLRRREVSTASMEYIYVHGGQTLGGFDDTLLRYRISTDLWEAL